MSKNKFADLLLEKASHDLEIAREVLDKPYINDDVIGFHLQQVVEKSLKALLVSQSVRFGKTHNIDELYLLAKDHNISLPDDFEAGDKLTSFAVEFRYDTLEAESEFDRHEGFKIATACFEYAKKILAEI